MLTGANVVRLNANRGKCSSAEAKGKIVRLNAKGKIVRLNAKMNKIVRPSAKGYEMYVIRMNAKVDMVDHILT